MAKSKSFFGLRRGSTKSMTFQVLNGAQITKDRVADVKNPRTTSQMVQRMIMSTAGAAYKHFKPIVDHSFEGCSYGQKSYSKFMQLNVNRMVNDIEAGNNAFSYNPFGDTNLYASPFTLSAGSLKFPLVNSITYETDSNSIIVNFPFSPNDWYEYTFNQFMDLWGVRVGDYLTLCLIYNDGLSDIYKFAWIRMEFISGSDKTMFDVDCDEVLLVTSNHEIYVNDIESDEMRVVILSTNVVEYIYGTAILSRRSNGKWLRSNSQIIFPGSPVNSPTAAQALATYPQGAGYVLNGADIG